MPYAIKVNNRVQAWELGAGSAMEQEMIRRGKIAARPDGTWEIFSQESTEGSGQVARFQCGRIPHGNRDQVRLRVFDFENRQITVRIGTDHGCLPFDPVGIRDRNFDCVFDNMVVGHDVPFFIPDESRAGTVRQVLFLFGFLLMPVIAVISFTPARGPTQYSP